MLKQPLLSLLIGCAAAGIGLSNTAAMDLPAETRIGGFPTGCQAYTFRNFTALEAIERTAQAGGRIIEFYPGQRFSPDHGDLRWNHEATEEMIAAVEEHLRRFNVLPVSYGVVEIPQDAEGARKIFDFARRLGMKGVATASVDSLDVIEEMVKTYGIHVAFHNHPRRGNQPEYQLWDPAYLKELLQDRDPRIGACADTGHWLRSGLDPVESLRLLEGRILSLHLKDRAQPEGHDVIFGTGSGILPAVLEELKRQEFTGPIFIEYEHNWDDSVPDVAQSVGFIRGFGAARGWSD
jgi:sugar phosphate isomerase/epimerase